MGVAIRVFVRPWLDVDGTLTEYTHHGRVAYNGGLVNMLVTMKEQGWPGAVDVVHKAVKPLMHITVSLMDAKRRIVGNKNIHRRKSPHQA